jgi:hypothetical protein
MKLIALKSMGRLRPGDEFEVNRTQARALKALKKAEDAPIASPADVERDELRARAEAAGIEVDGRWGAERLQQEIAAAEQPPPRTAPRFYRRRDMQPEE